MLAAAQVIEVVASRVALAPDLAASTYTDHPWPFAVEELPAARVIAGTEEIGEQTINRSPVERHDLDVVVELRVQASEQLHSAMHAITAAALTQLHSNASVQALADIGVTCFRTNRIERRMDDEGEAKAGAVDIFLTARFFAGASTPEAIVGA